MRLVAVIRNQAATGGRGRPGGYDPTGRPANRRFDDYGGFAWPLAGFTREMVRRGMAGRIVELGRSASLTVYLGPTCVGRPPAKGATARGGPVSGIGIPLTAS